jgi:GPH family glycoside/pentoside/hexuronide:cation symporter
MNTFETSRVPASKRIAYAAPAFALAVVGIPIYVYIPKFYTDVVGVNIALVGYLLLAVRVFDAVTDPLIGVLSDKTRTRFGRRRPYIAGGVVILAVAMVLLFNPPDGSPVFTTLWFGISIFALFLFWTLVTVPYESLGPEITFNYDERTALFGLRDGALIAGTLVAASSPAAVEWIFSLSADPAGERAKFFWIAAIYAPLVVAFCWWCVLAIREIAPSQSIQASGWWRGLGTIRRNKPFGILLVSYTISAFGNNLPATLILFYVQYVLRSEHADFFLLLYFVTGVLFLPGWIALSKALGKKWTWLSAIIINTGAFFGVFLLGPGDTTLYGILVFISGIGFGATVALPSAIQADVIDYDELLVGARREGLYIGIWSVTKKLAAALGVGVSLSILGLVGYEPNVEQTPSVVFTLRVLYALVPCICNAVAFFVLLPYPISKQVHEDIREAIDQRKKGGAIIDPVSPGRELPATYED